MWTVTAVDSAPRRVESQQNERFSGYRLRPGTVVDQLELLAWVEKGNCADIVAVISACTYIDDDVEEALAYLSNGRASIDQTSRSIGVSTRTLQRKIKAVTGKTPIFWSNLARARKSIKALATDQPLAHIAFENGYADQAHLTREVHKWFGRPPMQIRQNPSAIEQIIDTGYGNLL